MYDERRVTLLGWTLLRMYADRALDSNEQL
jgi:hypothetical protein